jgi:hypothetical protein
MAKKMSDKELAALLSDRIASTTGFSDTRMSKEREKVARYYNGELPTPIHAGNSKYVSMDVYDSVETMKAQLLETFSGNHNCVRFAGQGSEDVPLAEVATEYANFVVFRQNNGYQVFHDVIHNGLTARVGICKVFWDRETKRVEESFEGLTEEEFMALFMEPDVEDYNDLAKEADGTYSGTLVRTRDVSQVRLDVVPPEEFMISARAKDIRDADIVGQRTRKTASDLIRMGIPKSVVEDLSAMDDIWLTTEPEVQARFSATDANVLAGLDYTPGAPDRRRIDLYEIYMQVDLDGSGVSQLWKFLYAGNRVLDKERADRVPYVAFVPLPVPHTFFGNNYAARVIPTQNARTVLVRGILDHTVITNNPRYEVLRGALPNPRELMENRVGGIVNVTRQGAILPLPQSGLNPFVFQTVQLLDADKEESTGISSLSQGLNKDAISKQNSADMVGQLVSLSQQRQKVVARQFAEGFLKPLWIEVYQLIIENEKQEKVIEVAGKYVPVAPSSWSERRDVYVEFALGYGEKEREAQKYIQMDMLLSADEELRALYPLEKRHATVSRAIQASGIKDVSTFLLTPEEAAQAAQAKGPDPMVMMQMQMAMKELEIKEREVAIKEAQVQIAAQMKGVDLTIKDKKVTMGAALDIQDLRLKQQELDHKMEQDRQELALASRAQESRAIYAPDS